MTDKTSLAKTYLAASDHDQGSTLWMQSNIMDHLCHYDISFDDYWAEVKKLRREGLMGESTVVTIAMLRDRLDELEEVWVRDGYPDVFGEFGHQPVLTDHHTLDGDDIKYAGIGNIKIHDKWELGLLILPDEFHGKGREIADGNTSLPNE